MQVRAVSCRLLSSPQYTIAPIASGAPTGSPRSVPCFSCRLGNRVLQRPLPPPRVIPRRPPQRICHQTRPDAALLQPPTPIVRTDNWPLLAVSRGPMQESNPAADPAVDDVEAPAWADDDLDLDNDDEPRAEEVNESVKKEPGAWDDDEISFDDDDLTFPDGEKRKRQMMVCTMFGGDDACVGRPFVLEICRVGEGGEGRVVLRLISEMGGALRVVCFLFGLLVSLFFNSRGEV